MKMAIKRRVVPHPPSMATDESVVPDDPATVAFGITVPKALGDFLVLKAVRDTGGTAVAVTRSS